VTKFKNIGGNTWVHEDIAPLALPKKPPDWMAEHLVRAYTLGFNDGEKHVQDRISDALGFLALDAE